MILPTIHLNGTSKAELIHQLCEAHGATEVAFTTLMRAEPHPRDYPRGGYDIARTEHMARLLMLRSVCRDLEQMHIRLYDEG